MIVVPDSVTVLAASVTISPYVCSPVVVTDCRLNVPIPTLKFAVTRLAKALRDPTAFSKVVARLPLDVVSLNGPSTVPANRISSDSPPSKLWVMLTSLVSVTAPP